MVKHLITAVILGLLVVPVAYSADEPQSQEESWNDILNNLKQKDAQYEGGKSLAKNQYREFLSRIDNGKDQTDRLRSEIEAWNEQVQPLLDSEEGRFLASNPDTAKEVRSMFKLRESVSEQDPDRLKESLKDLSSSVEEILAKIDDQGPPPATIETEVKTRVDAYVHESEEKRKTLSTLRRSIARLLEKAKTENERGPDTLQDAFDDMDMKEAIKKGFRQIELQAETERIAAEQAAEAERRRIALQAQADALRHQVQQGEIRLQQQRQAEKAAQDALLAKIDSPDVKERLGPFITPGYRSPTPKLTLKSWKTARFPEPLSLSTMQWFDCLEDNPEGYYKLWEFATHTNNDRPHWSIQCKTEEDLEWIRESQQLLIELAPILQEKGKLNP